MQQVTAYKTTDGQLFENQEEARKMELTLDLKKVSDKHYVPVGANQFDWKSQTLQAIVGDLSFRNAIRNLIYDVEEAVAKYNTSSNP